MCWQQQMGNAMPVGHSSKKFSQICSILDEFETKAPADAISSLESLARLSLCEDYHQGQAFEKIDEWEVAIEEATQFYESGRGLKEKNRELKDMLKEERLKREELERNSKQRCHGERKS